MTNGCSTQPQENGPCGLLLGLLLGGLIVGGCTEPSTPKSPAPPPPEQWFTPVTDSAGLDEFRHVHGGFGEKWFPEIMGSGGALVDYNSDGWLDVVLVGGGSLPSRPPKDVPALSLYRNNGDGTFTDVTEAVGLSEVRAYGFGVTAADYDNDGDPDLFLTTLQENLLFRNDDGVFREVGQEAGLADVARWSASAMFFDADRDGHLDLYVTNYVAWSPETNQACTNAGVPDYCNPAVYDGIADTYYHNNGDGTFTNRTEEAGFLEGVDPARAKGLGVGDLDFNRDGWTDVYVANDGEANYLFVNNGDGTFTETAVRSGVAFNQRGTPRAGMGVDAGVVDSTGAITLVVGNFSEETVGVWRHQSNGLFVDRAAASGLGYPTRQTLTFGIALFDVDLDTDLDLLLANGHVIEQIAALQDGVTLRQPPQLFLNRGDGTFTEVAPTRPPLTDSLLARGLAVGDIDRDGALDVLLTENNGPAHLWRNDGPEQHVLRVDLEGTESNRDGIGARIEAEVGDLTMIRRVRTGTSYLSRSELTATFGLDTARAVDQLTVHWPSGTVERFKDVAANQTVQLVEGNGELVPVPAE